jgi:hypothetical protein
MAEDGAQQSKHLELANRFVGLANELLKEHGDAEAIGLAMTHAAANFTAFAAIELDGSEAELKNVAGEFERLLLSYYANRKAS